MADRPKLKILFERPSNAEAHARALVRKIDKHNLDNTYEPKPYGIAHYSAVMPEVCDDCGQTYWTRQGKEWTSHIGCTGAPPKGGAAGF